MPDLNLIFKDWDAEKPDEGEYVLALRNGRLIVDWSYKLDLENNPDNLIDIWIGGDLNHDDHEPPDFWARMPSLQDFYEVCSLG